jgi:hypothetical protein
MLGVLDQNVSLARAGAVGQYVSGAVIFCGGQSLQKVHNDCLMYNPLKDTWANFSTMVKARDEAAIANAGNVTYVIGGIGEITVEFVDMTAFKMEPTLPVVTNTIPKSRQGVVHEDEDMLILPKWKLGPSLPEIRSRSCAVASDPNSIFIVGTFCHLNFPPFLLHFEIANW